MGSCKLFLTFESVDEILWREHSNETSSAVLSHGTIYLGSFPFVRTDRPGHSRRNENFTFYQSYPARSVKS